MGKFILFILGFFISLLIIVELICTLLLSSISATNFLGIKNGFLNIKQITYNRSKKDIGSDTLYIGDSVARQLFPSATKDNHITSVAAILPSGNYEVVENVIKKNPNLKAVYYGAIPSSLGLDFNEEKTSLNYIKPFLSIYRAAQIDTLVWNKLWEQPKSLLYLSSTGKFLPLDDINFDDQLKYEDRMSRFSVYYLHKLQKLCDENNVSLKLYCPPLSSSRSTNTANFQRLKNQKVPINLRSMIPDYISTIDYLPAAQFKDGTHLKKKHLRDARRKYRKLVKTL